MRKRQQTVCFSTHPTCSVARGGSTLRLRISRWSAPSEVIEALGALERSPGLRPLFLTCLEYDRLQRHPERIRAEIAPDCRCERVNNGFDGHNGALLKLGSKRTAEDCSSSKDCGRRHSGLQADNCRTDAGETGAEQRFLNWIDLVIAEWSRPFQAQPGSQPHGEDDQMDCSDASPKH